jgi:hypothetical protein
VVDGAGDLFVTDYFSNKVLEVPAGGGTPTILLSYPAVYEPNAVAVDGTGNVFVASAQEPSGVLEVNRGQPPSLSFASTQLGKTSSDSPKSVTVQNIGNPPLDAVSPGLVVSGPNFVQVVGTGTPADCGTGFSASPLAPGGICNLSINFEPQTGGMLTSTAVFTDNALNTSPSATQSISLQGTGAGNGTPPQITSANSATFIVGTSNLFTVTTTGTPTPSLSENGTLPFGVSFLDDGDGTGTLCGTPTVSGIFNISFTAHNAVVPDAIQSFTLTVDQAPAITSGNNTAFILGTGGTFSVTASGFPTPTVTESGALPNGVTFTGGSGSGMLSGTPTQSGMFNITL